MKTTIKTLLTVIILLGVFFLGTQYNKPIAKELQIKSIETTESGSLTTYEDGTGYYQEADNNDNTIEVSNVLYQSTNDFYLDNGEIGIELSNNDYIILNTIDNTVRYNDNEAVKVSKIETTPIGVLITFNDNTGYYIEY